MPEITNISITHIVMHKGGGRMQKKYEHVVPHDNHELLYFLLVT